MSAIRLGVVVPTLNEEKLLPRLLERLGGGSNGGASDDLADSIVVSDGGSTDGTQAIAEATGAIVCDSPAGRGRQLAAGARLLEADVLLFLHADTLPAPGALSVLREAYSNPDVHATAMCPTFDAEGWLYRSNERFSNWRSRKGWVYGDCGLGVRREVYEEVGGFRDMSLFEDVDLSRRLKRMASLHVVTESRLVVSTRRWEADGALRYTLRNWILILAYLAGGNPERLARYYRPHSPAESV